MKIASILSVLVLAACGAAPSRSAVDVASTRTLAGESMSVREQAIRDTEQEIMRLQEAWVQAAVDADADTFATFMHDNFQVVSRGRVRDKATWVESIRSGRATYEAVQYHSVDVDVYGDTIAVISGEYSQAAMREGQDNSGRGVFVATWAKRGGQWRAVASIYP